MAAKDRVLQSSLFGNTILQKLQSLAEVNDERQARVEENTAKAVTSMNAVERLLAVQNQILLDIKDSMGSGRGTKTATGGIDLKDLPKFGLMATGAAAASIVAMSAAIAIAANVLNFVPEGNLQMLSKFLVVLGTVGTLALVAPTFVKIMEVLSGIKTTTSGSFGEGQFTNEGVDVIGALSTMGGAVVAMIGMSAGIAISSHILSLTYGGLDILPKLGVAILVSLTLMVMAPVFVNILQVLSGMQSSTQVGFEGMEFGRSGADVGGMLANVGVTLLAVVGMSLAVAAASYVLNMTTPVAPEKLLSALAIGIILIPIAYAYSMVLKVMPGVSIGDVVLAAAAIPLMVLGVVGALHIWNALALSEYAALPPIGYFLAFGFILLVTATTFYILAQAVKGLSIKETILAGLAIPVMVAGLALSLFMWNMLAPDEIPTGEQAIDPMWALKTAIGLTLFALPTFILGKIGLGTVVQGAIGLVLLTTAIAASIAAASFILPDDAMAVADTLSYVMMSPVNALIDVLVRLVNEVGVGNLLPLAGGIVAIAGSMMVLSAAMVGVAAGGVVNALGSLATGALDAITSFVTGEKKSSGAVETLLLLADNATKIQNLAMPLTLVSKAMSRIGLIQPAAIDKAARFLKDLDKYKFDRQAVALAKIANAYTAISKASNQMDVEAMQETNNMFKILTELGKATNATSIEKLSKALVEALEALAGVVSELKPAPAAATTTTPTSTIAATNQQQQTNNAELIRTLNEMIASLEGTLNVRVVNDRL